MSRHPIVTIMFVAVTLASGCGTAPTGVTGRRDPVVTTPMPAPPAASPSSSPSPSPASDCNPRASLRPRRSPPAPGAMPAGSPMEAIAKRGNLRVGIGASGYQLGFRDPYTGKVDGFEAELAKAIARAIFGQEDHIQWRALNTAERAGAITRGEVDIVLAAMTITCRRLQDLAFSAEYFHAQQRVLVRRDSTAKELTDLAGKKVCASATSTNIEEIRKRSTLVPVEAANTSDCLLMLQQGQVDAVSTGDIILAGLQAQDPGTKVVGSAGLTDEPTGIVMARNADDLVRFVNGVLERWIASGEWQKQQRKWLGSLGELSPPVPQYSD